MDDPGFGQTFRPLHAGEVAFRRYRLERILGQGGMGQVWLADDEKLGKPVALKFLPNAVHHDPVAVDELKRETRRGQDLRHPHIVAMYDFVEGEGKAAIAMEYVEGQSLLELQLEQPNRVFEADDQLKAWMEQISGALSYAHEKVMIVHRDLKPSNLLFDEPSGDIKIADFGIARTLGHSGSPLSRAQLGVEGSLPYMSPQHLLGELPSVSDDIYGLGATIYELLTGKPPFHMGNLELQIREKVPPLMRDRKRELEIKAGEIPESWERTVAACLAKAEADRPQTVAEVLAGLDRLEPVIPFRESKGKGAGKKTESSVSGAGRWIAAIIAFGALATGGVAFWKGGMGNMSPDEDPDRWGIALHRKPESAKIEDPVGTRSENGGEGGETPVMQSGTPNGPEISAIEDRSDSGELKSDAAAKQLAPLTTEYLGASRTFTEAESGNEIVAEFVKYEAGKVILKMGGRLTQVELARLSDEDREFVRRVSDGASDPIVAKPLPLEDEDVNPVSASKERPFVNSLGMKFVPVPIGAGPSKDQIILFSIWETRVQDYATFAAANPELDSEWMNYEKNGHVQGLDHPVVNLKWEAAKEFCAWLARTERAAGRIGRNDEYRLPKDLEWSYAVGIGDAEDASATPKERHLKIKDVYPWGTLWPPPDRVGNFGDTEAARTFEITALENYHDGHAFTAPVGSFQANEKGIYDLGGNVWEWCAETYDGSTAGLSFSRGASWFNDNPSRLLSSNREIDDWPFGLRSDTGFRVILVVSVEMP